MAYSQEIFLFGRRRGTGESIWDIKRRINYFGPEQIHFLLPSAFLLTGRQWIHASRKNHPQLESLITFFHLSDWIDHPIRSLSSGQVQLLMLVNLFLDDRELLLLDEPFQFLDAFNHGRVTDYMNHYLNKDTTLILITHDEADVIRWTQLRKQI